ncbi:MAG: DnaA/Hda family protein, partial [Myxococcota bacterium]
EARRVAGTSISVDLAIAESSEPVERPTREPDRPRTIQLAQRKASTRPPEASQPSAPPPRTPAVHVRSAQQAVLPHTFDNFVVGPCNTLAREASLCLASPDTGNLRHLYLSSSPGLGKTHLCHAVVAETRRQGDARVLYTSSENFTSEFMNCLRTKQTARFKRRYRRECNVLVLEDIQFLQGKAATQLELFHTIQHLLDSGQRVLVTGNRLPQEIPGLDSRIRSQLATGLVAELEVPGVQVRRDILRAKAAGGGFHVPPDCLDPLLESVHGNVRELEGVLIQLVTTASLLKRPIDRTLTLEALEKKSFRGGNSQRLKPDAVVRSVAAFFKTTPDVLASRSRRRDVLVPRQLAMYLCHRYTDASVAEIGQLLGRDHPAVRNAINRIERDMLERAPLRYKVEALCERINGLTP